MKEQKKNNGSVFVAESAYNAQKAQFGLIMHLNFFLSFLKWRRLKYSECFSYIKAMITDNKGHDQARFYLFQKKQIVSKKFWLNFQIVPAPIKKTETPFYLFKRFASQLPS